MLDQTSQQPHLAALAPVSEHESMGNLLCVFLKSEKCGRGGDFERKKVEKGRKGRESAVFNER